MKLHALALSIFTLALSACSSSSGGGGAKDITRQNITGTWEVTTISYQDKTVPFESTDAGNELGYKASKHLQYEISETDFTVAEHDGVAVDFEMSKKYKLNGKKLEPENSKSSSLDGFEIVEVTANSMTVIPEVSQPPGIRYGLTRIAASEFGPRKLQPIPESLTYGFDGPGLKLSETLNGALTTHIPSGTDGISMSCNYHKQTVKPTPEIYLGFSAYHYQNGTISTGGGLPDLLLTMPLQINFAQAHESIAFNANSSVITGSVTNSGTKVSIYGVGNAVCGGTFQRSGRMLDISMTCPGVSATPDGKPSVTGALTVHEKCVITF